MNRKQLIIVWGIIVFSLLFCNSILAENGTYDATVTTDSGIYSVPVEVEGEEVTKIYWPNGGDMSVSGAEIIGKRAIGANASGDSISVELLNYNDDSRESEE